MMNCWHCGPDVQLIWGGDFSGEDYCNDEISIVSNLHCPKCGSYVEVYLPRYHFEEKKEPIDTAPCSIEDDPVCDI